MQEFEMYKMVFENIRDRDYGVLVVIVWYECVCFWNQLRYFKENRVRPNFFTTLLYMG